MLGLQPPERAEVLLHILDAQPLALGHTAVEERRYAHWIPRGDKRWIDRLAARRAAAAAEVGTKSWHQTRSAADGVLELPETTGAGGGS